MRLLKNILIAFFSFSAVVGWYALGQIPQTITYAPQAASAIVAVTPPPVQTKETTLVFVGDVMLDRGVKYSVDKNFFGNYATLFDNGGYLKEADIAFGNLEGPVSDLGKNVGSMYSFRMDPQILPVLKNTGLDIVSFANNHVGDWSSIAFDDTRTRLTDVSILYTGAGDTKIDAETPTVIVKNGTRFGFLGFSDVGPVWLAASETKSGILLASDPRFEEIIAAAKQKVDVLIVSVHWGEEYQKATDRQILLAHRAVDAGASLVVGHHPHVAQATEKYNGGYIAYSLGNYIFDQDFSKEVMEGLVLTATFEGDTIKNVEKKISVMNKFFQPQELK